MKNVLISILIIAHFTLFSCGAPKKVTGNYSYKTQCIRIELDGSQTLKAWGSGNSEKDAIEQAKIIAIRDVLFNGIYEGKQDCEKRPVLVEVNAQQKNEIYFNNFFSEEGDYNKFVSIEKNTKSEKIVGGNQSLMYGVVVRVQRADLKQKMIEDGILQTN